MSMDSVQPDPMYCPKHWQLHCGNNDPPEFIDDSIH